MLYYLPLEPYRERYTMQLSAPKNGWYERNWINHNIPYKRIEGQSVATYSPIRHGQVLDATRRCMWSMHQMEELMVRFRHGTITNDDVIFLDDFWTPGFESLPYVMHQTGINPKIYAYCWAQSVDPNDFTHPMRHWMRMFEIGIGEVLSGIFVASTALKELLISHDIGDRDEIHVVGLPFDSEEVMERMPEWYKSFFDGTTPIAKGKETIFRKNQVVFSSRWDKEKNPAFFCDVANRMLTSGSNVQFVVCTSAPKIRSNDPALLELLQQMCEKWPKNFFLEEGLSKGQYYETLCRSKIQFNCAEQDWVSFTLLEASVAGCYPVYPYYLSFPETFQNRKEFMYGHKFADAAIARIESILERDDLWTKEEIEKRFWIHKRYDWTWARILHHMGVALLEPEQSLNPYEYENR